MNKQDVLQIYNKYKIIFEYSREIIIFFNQYGYITDCNESAKNILGYGDEIYSVPITDIFRNIMKFIDYKLVINMKYQDRAAETAAYKKNQTCFPVSLKINTVGGFRTFIGVCTAMDISDQKRMFRDYKQTKSELKNSRKLKNEFIANITHELKTPVNGIMGLTDNLLETELSPKQLETVNIVHRCCMNMSTLINKLLDFTKLENNKIVLEQREFSFRKMIDNMIRFNMPGINEKGLNLTVNVANDIPDRLVGDEYRIMQVLNNLFSNAIKFTSVGQIVLEVVKTVQTRDELELFFMVIDTGIGISREDQDKLFRSFSQVDGSITRRFGGTGLGLSICRMLVKAMHGSINVESDKNKGSTFSFTVRLGIPQNEESMLPLGDNGFIKIRKDDPVLKKLSAERVMETDYIEKILDKAGLSSAAAAGTYFSSISKKEGCSPKSIAQLADLIERLSICIEMESWAKAEELAVLVKKFIPPENKGLSNRALQLLLLVRREDHDNSIIGLKELSRLMNEVT